MPSYRSLVFLQSMACHVIHFQFLQPLFNRGVENESSASNFSNSGLIAFNFFLKAMIFSGELKLIMHAGWTFILYLVRFSRALSCNLKPLRACES